MRHSFHYTIQFLFPANIPTGISAQMHFLRILIIKFRIKDILGHINDHRPRTAGAGNKKSFL